MPEYLSMAERGHVERQTANTNVTGKPEDAYPNLTLTFLVCV